MSEIYEFLVVGDVDTHWSKWFGGLEITHRTQGETIIRGPMRDQAELYGVLNKFRDLGFALISVRRVSAEK